MLMKRVALRNIPKTGHMGGDLSEIKAGAKFKLGPWDYVVFSNK